MTIIVEKKKVGRPKVLVGGARYQVYLDTVTIKKLMQCDENLSAAIRMVTARMRTLSR